MGRYGNNIRRIAQTDMLVDRIRQAEQKITILDKSAIPGSRAIAYPSGAGQNGSPGVTNADKSGSPDIRFPSDKDATDGAGRSGGSTDGDDIIDGTRTLQKGDDPGSIALKDCDSGEEIEIIMGTASNEGETKFKHPSGWSISGEAGNDDGYENWELGYYWSGNSAYFPDGGDVDAPVPEIGVRAAIGFRNDAFGYTVTDVRNVNVVYNSETSASVGVEYYLDWDSGPNDGWYFNQQSWGRSSCESETGTDRCIASIPQKYETWQDQDPNYKHQLAFSAQDGGFVSSSKDEGLPAKFRNDVGGGKGLNNLRLCTNTGEEVVFSALIDGSFAYFKDDGFGFPEEDEKIFHFDKDGKYQDTIRPDEYKALRSTNNPAA